MSCLAESAVELRAVLQDRRPLPRSRSKLSLVAIPVLLLYSAFLFFHGIDSSELYRTESLRAIIADGFLRSGNWIVPTLYGEPLLTKPPGMYAAIAACSAPFGTVAEWTARLPSALAATATVFLFWWYFRRLLGEIGGLTAALLLPISLAWMDKATSAEIDMMQLFWVAGAVIFLLMAMEKGTSDLRFEEDSFRKSEIFNLRSEMVFWLLALICVAGGVLTKWTAPAFFYGTAIPLLWWRGRLRLLLGWQHLVSAAIAAAVCIGWAVAVAWQVGWDVLHDTVQREILVRILPSHHRHSYPWMETLTHPFLILAASLPVSIFALPAMMPRFGRLWDDRGRLLWQGLHCWIWPNMFFWSLIPEHSPRHCLPLLPGIAGLAAMTWTAWLTGKLSWPIPKLRPGTALATLVVLWLGVKAAYVHAVVPARMQGRDARATGMLLAGHVPEGDRLYLFRFKDEGIMFYYGRPAQRLAGPEQIPSTGKAIYCILTEAEWRDWNADGSAERLLRLHDSQGAAAFLVRVFPTSRQTAMNPSFLPPDVKVLSVTELNQAVKTVLEEGFPSVWVSGEISNLARPSSGHLYLTLKDANAQVRSVIWRSIAIRTRFEPRDGMEVFALGRLSAYPPRGDYQFHIEQLIPKGIGELELALRQLREKLFRLGWFEPGRKKPLPAFPRRVALVTSPSGAAIRDILEILGRRWPAVEVVLCPVRVQGDGAAEEIAAAITRFNRLHTAGSLPVDVMIIGRGGGSLEDLWAFNAECVARAIFESRIPVVSAVGHEVDVTIADLVADRRALTPSEAAELVVPDRAEQREALENIRQRIGDLTTRRVVLARRRLDDLAGRRVFRMPLERIRDLERRLDEWGERLGRGMRQKTEQARRLLEASAGRLETLSPLNVLARGYSLTSTEETPDLVRSAEQVQPGQRIVTRLHKGRIISRVEEVG